MFSEMVSVEKVPPGTVEMQQFGCYFEKPLLGNIVASAWFWHPPLEQ